MDVSGEFVLARNVALVDGPLCGGGSVGRGGDDCDVAFLDDNHAVRLVSRFRRPTTICDAIWDTAIEVRRHPEDILDRCYPLIRSLIADGYIVAAGSEPARRSHLRSAMNTVG